MKLSQQTSKKTLNGFFGMPVDRYPNGMIKLTVSNSIEVEKQISGDRKYGNDKAKASFDKCSGNRKALEKNLFSIIWAIKQSNSIRGVEATDGQKLATYIREVMHFDVFLNLLRDKNGVENVVTGMVNYLASHSHAGHQLSWCSKICKYLDCWYWGGSNPNYRNHFAVYDRVVATVLPYYLKEYGLSNHGKLWYPNDLMAPEIYDNYDIFNRLVGKLLRTIHTKDGQMLTKYRLDHLLWYQYKNYEGARLKKAIESYL
jgi:hypothetical protein